MVCVTDDYSNSLEIPMGYTSDIHQDNENSLDTSSEYEIPENIQTLHQLTLQCINQVKLLVELHS